MAKCATCGKEITDGHSCNKCNLDFCSNECRYEHNVDKHGYQCANCGKKFLSRKYIRDKETPPNIFCSEDCFRSFKAIKCDNCGNNFTGKYYSKKGEEKLKFCSKRCLEEYYS